MTKQLQIGLRSFHCKADGSMASLTTKFEGGPLNRGLNLCQGGLCSHCRLHSYALPSDSQNQSPLYLHGHKQAVSTAIHCQVQ